MNGWAAVLARDYPGGRLQRQETPGTEAGPVHTQIFPLQGKTNFSFRAFFLMSPSFCKIPVRFFSLSGVLQPTPNRSLFLYFFMRLKVFTVQLSLFFV
jgi:hypothetical protein